MTTEPTEQQRRAVDAERLQYESVKTAISRARRLLDRVDVALTGQAYHAAVEQKALLAD